jgi:hypothetical protein
MIRLIGALCVLVAAVGSSSAQKKRRIAEFVDTVDGYEADISDCDNTRRRCITTTTTTPTPGVDDSDEDSFYAIRRKYPNEVVKKRIRRRKVSRLGIASDTD